MTPPQQPPLGGADEPSRPLAEGVTDYALFLIGPDGRIASWNEGARRILGYEEGDVLGRPSALLFTPEDRAAGVPEQELAAAACEGRAASVRWCQRRDGTRFWADGVLERLTGGEAGETVGFAKVLRDATRQHEAEARLALREERYRTLFGSIDQGFCIVEVLLDARGEPRDYRFIEVNPAFERHTGLANALGRTARGLVPNLDEFWFRTYGSVALTGQAARFESHAPAMGRWFDVYALPVGAREERRVAILFTDTTERRETLEALQAKNDEVVSILESVTDAFYAVDESWRFTYVNAEAERLLLRKHGELLGKNIWEEFPAAVGSAFETHYRRAARERATAVFQAYYPPPLDGWYDVRAYPSPTGGGLAVYFRNVTAERLREQERERLLEVQRARAEREALLNQIGAALRQTDDPEEVQARAVALLGGALGADRCFFTALDPARAALHVGRDWHRPGLASMGGEYPLAGFGPVVEDIFRGGATTAVLADAQRSSDAALSPESVAVLRQYGLRSQVAVAFSDGAAGGTVTAILTAAMADAPRDWTPEEVALIEAAATQTRTAVEAARVQRREHNIAQQLQAALQPPLPEQVPGLALAQRCRVALDEAEVGGDFFDAFPLEEGCTALVVGDLSGKGLAAASEVAAVRNMLRFALLNGRTLAEALAALNRTLVENGLIGGFATLFVGAYDGGARTLTYVNCGQEPALVWRAATGRVEELGSTGAILGGFAEEAEFEERAVTLHEGDAIAIFTDGLTEAGPTRSEMLGVSGVTALLARHAARDGSAASLAERLVAEADAYARGGIRDDVCLLVGVVQGT